MKEAIRTPGTKVRVLSKSRYHAGQTGIVDADYGYIIQVKADNLKHKNAYKSRIGKNTEGKDPKGFREGKYFMAYPAHLVQIA
jgi:hypothetical protein